MKTLQQLEALAAEARPIQEFPEGRERDGGDDWGSVRQQEAQQFFFDEAECSGVDLSGLAQTDGDMIDEALKRVRAQLKEYRVLVTANATVSTHINVWATTPEDAEYKAVHLADDPGTKWELDEGNETETYIADPGNCAEEVLGTFTAHGNWGTLLCDARTGNVMSYDRSGEWKNPGDGYDNIVRLNADEWRTFYPGQDISAGHDILDFGSWDNNGVYVGPEMDWRESLKAER